MCSLEMLSLFERKILKASERLISWWTSMKKVICKNIKKEINTLLFNYFFFFFKAKNCFKFKMELFPLFRFCGVKKQAVNYFGPRVVPSYL